MTAAQPPVDPQDGGGVEPDPVRGVQRWMTNDLWTAMGLPVDQFGSYYNRNGFADTWGALLSKIRNPLPCGKPLNDGSGEFCALAPHSVNGVCYGPSDVGSGEPLPDREPGDAV